LGVFPILVKAEDSIMKWSWRIGSFRGIGVYVHATFLILVGFVVLSYWSQGHSIAGILAGVGFIVALFSCVVAHEFGHALMAAKYGIKTRDITLLPIGGVARLERMPDDPRQELWVALAGPAVNVVIAVVLFAWLEFTATRTPFSQLSVTGGPFLQRLMVVNVFLARWKSLCLPRWIRFSRSGPTSSRCSSWSVLYVASGHAVLSKRDTRAAIGWVGVIWLAPLLGVLLYVWLGINRIERRARSLVHGTSSSGIVRGLGECPAEVLDQARSLSGTPLEPLVKLVRDVTRQPLLAGNRVTPLVNGDQAYPAMLQAIDEATRSVTLSTYIFAHDGAGQRFLDALRRAVSRQVEVRVLIDDVGARYSWRPMPRVLRQAGIPCAQFLPTLIPWRFQYSNLRSHRKILVVDGRIGFTGGINIDEQNCLERQPRHPVQDLHFRVTGPVVAQFQEAFADDWAFCTGELLQGEPWFSAVEPEGPVLARGIPDGPDDDFETLRLTLLGAIACARSSILVVTPYFLPDASLIAASERGRPARRPGRHRLARGERLGAGAVGLDGPPLAGAGTRLPCLALAPAVRSHQTDAGRRTLDTPGFRQLGPP
jgi:hypothetical protein